MLNYTNIKKLVKKHGILVQDTESMIKKYYSIKNQVLFISVGNEFSGGFLKFLRDEYQCLNDELMCNNSCSSDRLKELFESLQAGSDSEVLLPTGITCEYDRESYTVYKTASKRLIMVNSKYIDMFKEAYYLIGNDKNTNVITVINESGMEVQGIIMCKESVEGMTVKEYIESQL